MTNLSSSQKKLLACFGVLLLTFGCYWDMLGYGLTGCDTLTLIEKGRIQSFEDVKRTFSSGLMEGSSFSSTFKYYRPIASLSYALDYALWGLEPFGYLLHNLALHGLNGLLLFWLTLRIAKRHDIAFAAAALFICNPVLIETVPGIPRRQDILPICFLLIALLANTSTSESKLRYLHIAIGCAATALGLMSKESAALIVVHIFAYNLLVPTFPSKRASKAVLRTLPYVVTILPVLYWRSTVLDGLGGTWRNFLRNEYQSIVFEFLSTIFSPLTFVLPGIAFGVAIVCVSLLTILAWLRPIWTWVSTTDPGRTALFAAAMLVNAIALYLTTAVYGPWMAYSTAAPYAMLFATCIISTLHYLGDSKTTITTPRRILTTLALVFWCGVIVLQYRFSPLVVRYDGWAHSSSYNEQVLEQIAAHIDQFPDPALVTIHNVPFRHFSGRDPTQVRSATYLRSYTIKSYLNLIRPGNEWFVTYRDAFAYRTVPETVRVDFQLAGPQHVDLTVRYPEFSPQKGEKIKINRIKRSDHPVEAREHKEFNEGKPGHPFRGRPSSKKSNK